MGNSPRARATVCEGPLDGVAANRELDTDNAAPRSACAGRAPAAHPAAAELRELVTLLSGRGRGRLNWRNITAGLCLA